MQGVINDLLLTVPRSLSFDNIEVGYSLVGDGVYVSSEYISMVLDGTVHLVNDTNFSEKDKVYTKMPLHDRDASEIQMMISEYTLNSALFTAV